MKRTKLKDRVLPIYTKGEEIFNMVSHIVGATMGCCLLYFGVAMFIVADIGLDPFTGFVMVLRDKLKREYKYVKIFFDIACVVIGFSLGGRLGVITIITSLFAGPTIQFFTMNIKKVTKKV